MSSVGTRDLCRALFAAVFVVFAADDCRASPSSDCLGCHAHIIDSPSSHFIESNDDCLFCHRVVGATTSHLQLDNIGASLCAGCHVRESLALATTEHRSLACTSCHDPHGSEHDHNHVAERDALCLTSCHTLHELGRSHPRGAGVRDVVTGEELTCVLACHSNHSAGYPMLLQTDRQQLCMRCHVDKY